MKPTPLHILVARLKRFSLPDRIAHLRVLLGRERPFSVRRGELQSLLDGAVLKQLKREVRAA